MTSDLNGIVLRIGATLFFTIMVLFVKWLAEDIPVGQVVFFRSAFALIPLVLFLMWTRDFPSGLRTKRPGGHVLRCLMGCIGMFTSFASLKYLPIAHASIIGHLAPILAIVLAGFLLGETVTGARWMGVLFGFIGMLVLILPQATAETVDIAYLIGIALALATAVLAAGAKIQIRSLALTENAGAIAFYFALTCTIAGLLTIGFGWTMPTTNQLLLLVGSGVAGGIAHIMMTLSLQYSEVSKLAAFEYLGLLFAVGADALFFNLLPEPVFYLSAAFIILSTLIVAFRDRRPRAQAA